MATTVPTGSMRELPRPSASVQLKAVMRKNLTLIRRNRADVVREVGWPIFLLAILILMTQGLQNESFGVKLVYDSSDVTSPVQYASQDGRDVLFAPVVGAKGDAASCTGADPVASVARAFNTSQVASAIKIRCFACGDIEDCPTDASSVSKYYRDNNDDVMAAVIFENPDALSHASLASPVVYRLRVDDSLMFGVGSYNWSQTNLTGPDDTASGWEGLYLSMQTAVDAAVGEVNGKSNVMQLATQEFPSGPYDVPIASQVLANILPIYLLLMFSLQVRINLTRILEEKERKLKEGMRMMGLTDEVFWLSWWFVAMAKGMIVVVVLSVVGVIGGLFTYSNPIVLFLYFTLFLLSCVSFVFMLTPFFNNAKTGGAVGMLGFLALFLPQLAIGGARSSGSVKLGMSILSPVAFSIGNSILNEMNGKAVGVSWGTLTSTDNQTQGVSFGGIMLMLLVDFLLYSVAAWYFDKVIPQQYGSALKPYFCCTRRYWKKRASAVALGDRAPLLDSTIDGDDAEIEAVSDEVSRRPGVRISGLSKTFHTSDGEKRAVDGLNLAMYEGQITALLGHNGAGKTTTVSILTGLFEATGGDAQVYGRSILDDMIGVRQLVGICPQHDVLWNKLTCREHLQLFAGLKGMTGKAVDAHIRELLADVGLGEKVDELADTLSGGQKRRLCVAIALTGDPAVIILDEPTSGLDPSSRRQLWDLLERRKSGRVILLTTHFMDEADTLGDRIAIMSQGKLQVAGSSLFLKSKFGVGYHLTVAANPSTTPSRLLEVIRSHVPLVELETSASATSDEGAAEGKAGDAEDEGSPIREHDFTLPLESVSHFSEMFADLDARKAELGIDSYGISITSLEEVFLRLNEEAEAEAALAKASDTSDSGSGIRSRTGSTTDRLKSLGAAPSGRHFSAGSSRPAPATSVGFGGAPSGAESAVLGGRPGALDGAMTTGWAAFARQFKAVMWRRMQQNKRDKKALWLQIVVPMIFVTISFVFRSIGDAVTVSGPEPQAQSPEQWSELPSMTLPYAFLGVDNTTRSAVEHAILHGVAPSGDGMPSFVERHPASIHDFLQSILDDEYQAAALLFQNGTDGNVNATLLYNTSLTNGLPIVTSIIDGADLVGSAIGATGKTAKLALESVYWAFPHVTDGGSQLLPSYIGGAVQGMYIAMGFCIIGGLQAFNIVKEKETRAKQQQFIMGVSAHSYWAGQWVYDALCFVAFPWIGTLVLIFAIGAEALKDNIGAVAVVLLLFGFAIPGPAYAMSFLFSNSNNAQQYTMLVNNILLIVLFAGSFITEMPQLTISPVWKTLCAVLSNLFPYTAMSNAFRDIATKASCVLANYYGQPCDPPSPFSWDIAGEKIAFLIGSIICWFCLILFLERRYGAARKPGTTRPHNIDEGAADVEDEDVRAERTRIDSGRGAAADNVRAVHLRKEYGTGKVAVKDLCLGLKEGECFGLLGPNGAGKTTSMSMLCGQLTPSYGAATLHGLDIYEQRAEVYKMLGFCPQQDCLFDFLTGTEVLQFYARVKGVPQHQIPGLVENALTRMDLTKYRHVLTSTYSGGNKRKLSMAVAFVGAPRTICLDEPSTGMDPGARRKMWDVILNSKKGRTVILSTHLMEEAEALCNRIGIVVDGRMACLGTGQHLKQLYGAGYQVEVQTREPAKEELQELLQGLCEGLSDSSSAAEGGEPAGARLLEAHFGRAKFELPAAVRVADIFGAIEGNKERLGVEFYSVSQTSLEQVFLEFSKRQAAADELEAAQALAPHA